MRKFLAISFSILLMSCNPSSTTSEPDLGAVLMDQTEGCLEGPTDQFGRYIGDWDIQDWQLQQDGTTWIEQQGARWNFTCVGNGVAVQDFWMPNAGGYGTNLRMYDPKTEKWDIAWSATGTPGFSHITASKSEDGNMVMHYVSPEQTPPRRITFFKPSSEGWNWVMEMSFDKEQTWTPVYKIKATPRD